MKLPRYKQIDSHLREILSKSLVNFVLKVLGVGFGFVFQLSIARHLGTSGSGIYYLALTITLMVAMLGRLGMDNNITRYVAAHAVDSDWGRVKGVVRQGVLIGLMTSLALGVVLFLLADWISATVFSKHELHRPLELMAFLVFPLALTTIIAKALQGLKRNKSTMLMQGVLTPMIACVALFYLAPMLGVTGAVLSYGIGVIFTLVFGLWVWFRAKSVWGHVLPVFSSRELLASSLPLLFAALLQQLMLTIPLLSLGVWGDSSAVGIFGSAQRMAGLVSIVLIAANITVAPKLAELYQKRDMIALGNVARHGALIMTAMASPALILFFLAPSWVMGLYGAEFSTGWLLLVILALGQLVNVMTGSVGFILVMTGNERSHLAANLVATALCVVLAFTLIPAYNDIGAAIAAAIPIGIVNLLRVRYVWKKYGISTIPFVVFRQKWRK